MQEPISNPASERAILAGIFNYGSDAFIDVDDIVDGLWRIGMVNEKHKDAWELGTGINYSVNELAKMFNDKFGCSRHYIKEQLGNYRATLCESEDAMNILGWKPQDRLLYYINNLD